MFLLALSLTVRLYATPKGRWALKKTLLKRGSMNPVCDLHTCDLLIFKSTLDFTWHNGSTTVGLGKNSHRPKEEIKLLWKIMAMVEENEVGSIVGRQIKLGRVSPLQCTRHRDKTVAIIEKKWQLIPHTFNWLLSHCSCTGLDIYAAQTEIPLHAPAE